MHTLRGQFDYAPQGHHYMNSISHLSPHPPTSFLLKKKKKKSYERSRPTKNITLLNLGTYTK